MNNCKINDIFEKYNVHCKNNTETKIELELLVKWKNEKADNINALLTYMHLLDSRGLKFKKSTSLILNNNSNRITIQNENLFKILNEPDFIYKIDNFEYIHIKKTRIFKTNILESKNQDFIMTLKEEIIQNGDVILNGETNIRFMQRFSYKTDFFQIDLSTVKQNNCLSCQTYSTWLSLIHSNKMNYEIEIEFLNPFVDHKTKHEFEKELKYLHLVLNDTPLPLST